LTKKREQSTTLRTVRIPQELDNALETISKERGLSVNSFVSMLLKIMITTMIIIKNKCQKKNMASNMKVKDSPTIMPIVKIIQINQDDFFHMVIRTC
jgi:hypothetical protein